MPLSFLTPLIQAAHEAESTCDERRFAVYQALVEHDPELAALLQRIGSHEQCEDWLFHVAPRFGGQRPIDVYQADRAKVVDFLRRMVGDSVF